MIEYSKEYYKLFHTAYATISLNRWLLEMHHPDGLFPTMEIQSSLRYALCLVYVDGYRT